LRQSTTELTIKTSGPGLTEFTGAVGDWVIAQGVDEGLLTLFVRHTSASLLIQENADPDVQRDLHTFFERIAPWDSSLYRHTAEGEDDMPAHIRAALTQTSLSIPVVDARLALGTWQGIYLFEHRARAHTRNVVLHLMGN
jgi:secondary thiamine-phosphate synthase enzyme